MIFDYKAEEVFTRQLEVADIGNTCIRGTNDELVDFYLITKTVMGKTSIFKFGPVMPDLETMLDNYMLTYKKINYKEATICREIDMFINDAKKNIIDVSEILETEAFLALPNIEETYNNL